jgi:hypothetical protein
LFQTEFYDVFAHVEDSVVTTRVVEGFLEKGSLVTGLSWTFSQQDRLHLMTESEQDPGIKRLAILPSTSQFLNLVLWNSIEGHEEFTTNIQSIKTFHGSMGKNAAIRHCGKVCQDVPETRWKSACLCIDY